MIDITDVLPGEDLVVIRNIKPILIGGSDDCGSRVFAFNDVVEFVKYADEERAGGVYRYALVFRSGDRHYSSPVINFLPKRTLEAMVSRSFPDTESYSRWLESHRESDRDTPRPHPVSDC